MSALGTQEAQSLPNSNTTFQQKGADLVMMPVRWLTTAPYAVQPLQVELVGGLGRDELHRRALHRLRNGLRVAEVVLLSLRMGRTYRAGINRASWPSLWTCG